MWDSIYFACRDKLMKQPSSSAVRRAIILISDGEDNLSHVYRQEAIDMAQRAEVIIYTISTSLVERHTKGDDDLKTLAEATGGRAFFPVNWMTWSRLFLIFRKSCAASIPSHTGQISLWPTASSGQSRS